MRLYLDDNTASPLLARLLRTAGHDVQLPVDAGIAGKEDSVHLARAIKDGRVCLTRDYVDFENLHDLIMIAQGHHSGILLIREENNPRRDLTSRDIVRAIRNLEVANISLMDQCQVLNHWR
jgi:predicted nuclease of predicted toxin-antitoxin system